MRNARCCAAACVLVLSACGGGGNDSNGGNGGVTTYNIAGTVTGLPSGGSVILLDNGMNAKTIAGDGSFTFLHAGGTQYELTVGTQPAGERCMVAKGGPALLSADVTGVAVTCVAQVEGVVVSPGDGAISVSWQDTSAIEYFVFHAQDSTLTTLDWVPLLNSGVAINATSPTTFCNQINNPNPSPYFPETYFTIDGHIGVALGGPGSPLLGAASRPAGGPFAPWIAGAGMPVALAGLGYAAVTSCGYASNPPSGMYVAVGPNGSVYYSPISPRVAGPLTTANGNKPMGWTAGIVPTGFTANLTAVGGYAASINSPGAPGLIFAAVGTGGTILRSVDGLNWQQVSGVPTTSNLNAIAISGTTFIAVGDNGVVLTSQDALNWSLDGGAMAISNNKLNAIHCAGVACVAVGQSGTTMWTQNGGANWSFGATGANNWIGIAFGNNNANADALVSNPGGVLTVNYQNEGIHTWVVVDALGNFAYASSLGNWISNGLAIASSISAIDYTTRFVVLDAAGNAYASETGSNWVSVGMSGVVNPVALVSNGAGYVALGNSGTDASSF